MGEWQVSHVPEDDVDSKMSTKLSSKETGAAPQRGAAGGAPEIHGCCTPMKAPIKGDPLGIERFAIENGHFRISKKNTISMAMFNSYLELPDGNIPKEGG